MYAYDFDHTIADRLQLRRENAEVLHEALTQLRDKVVSWNDLAVKHGAETPPYQEEANDLTRMVKWLEPHLPARSRNYPASRSRSALLDITRQH